MKIVVGTNKRKSGGTNYEPDKLIAHESHGHPRSAYDIGLIRVRTPIDFNEKVQPIKLSKEFIGAGYNLMITGWGLLKVSGGLSHTDKTLLIKPN